MNICYVPKKFSKVHSTIIDQAVEIIEEYQQHGISSLTLRQVYYQFVGRNLFPDSRRWVFNDRSRKWVKNSDNGTKNTQQNYKWLGGILTNAKLAGALSWNAISDLTRELQTMPTWDEPSIILDACADQFKLNLWEGQPNRVFVWVEKDAGLSVVAQACRSRRVPYMSTRGFASMQIIHEEALRHKRLLTLGIQPIVILITDHDPSGMIMLADIENRFDIFGVQTIFKRICLTMDQVQEHSLPSDPAKLTDSRGKKYIEQYGNHAYELDALSAEVLLTMIEAEINSCIVDEIEWQRMCSVESEHKKTLRIISNNYDYIKYDYCQGEIYNT